MSVKEQARIILNALNEEYSIPGYLEEEVLRGIMAGLYRLEKRNRQCPESEPVAHGDLTMPTMYTIKQASEATGLSYDYLRKMCLQGRLVYVKAGSKFLINMEKLVLFLNGEPVEGT